MKSRVQKKENKTGLPDNLKSGILNLSGMSIDAVTIYYNIDQPAQLNSLAYAKGTEIHLSTTQEIQLPHEAWHVVQQQQGRVKATMQLKENVIVPTESALEKEAAIMGMKASVIVRKFDY